MASSSSLPSTTCACGHRAANPFALSQHKRWCSQIAPQAPAPPSSKAPKTTTDLVILRRAEATQRIGHQVVRMRLMKRMSIPQIDDATELGVIALHCFRELVSAHAPGMGTASPHMRAALDDVQSILQRLQRKDAVDKECARIAPNALSPIVRPTLAAGDESKSWFAIFSLKEIIHDILCNSSPATRQQIIKASEDWKSGDFLKEPEFISDITHGQRFRTSRLARKAEPGEERHVRIGLKMWNDDATVRLDQTLSTHREHFSLRIARFARHRCRALMQSSRSSARVTARRWLRSIIHVLLMRYMRVRGRWSMPLERSARTANTTC